MTTHALITPMSVDRLRSWCGVDAGEMKATVDVVATRPDAIDCVLCIDAMHHALAELQRQSPQLRRPGPRLVSVEALAAMLPSVVPADDALGVLALAREAVREGQRSARRVRMLEEREAAVVEILTGRREPKP